MENDQSRKIEDIGFVKICLYDEVQRILTQVRFISDMKKNLITLEMLDSNNFKCSSI